jgi:NAD+ synthase
VSNNSNKLSKSSLDIDLDAEIEKICSRIREVLSKTLRKRGLVVAISGGIDSSVCAALCVRAIGRGKVYGLLLPEQDSADASTSRGDMLASHLGVNYELFNIAPTLEAIGCYQQRDDAIRKIFPEYGDGWANKIVIQGGLQGRLNHFQLVVRTPGGEMMEERLPLQEYLQIVAATNFKQRIRKTMEYFHADRLNYAVVGTPNRLEYDQGFFVKNGDGSADVKPIAHLYKTQVYALARHMGLPEEICSAVPTTDTYSLDQGQDEFYFVLPYDKMDLALWALNQGHSAVELAAVLEIDVQHAEFVYKDIKNKRASTAYLHAASVLVERVSEITRR